MQIKFVQAMDNTTWRFDEAAAEAVQAKPAAIVAPNTAAARAFERHRSDMPPVIFSSFLDPVRYRVVATTSPRAESITGIWVAEDLDGKRVEILKDAYPHIKKVAVLMDRYWAENSDAAINLPKAAKQLDLTITLLLAEDLKDVTAVLDSAIARHFDAWCLPPSGVAYLNSDFILDRLRQWGKPVIVASPQDVERGAPLSYTVDENFRFAAMADLLRRVLEGEPAGSIPVQRPPQPKLAVRAMPTDGFPPPGAAVVKRADVVLR